MENKKLSSVEWLEQELKKIPFVNVLEVFEQAKEMEKEQHGNTWGNALSAVAVDKWESFEQYYNETYGGNKWKHIEK